MVQHSPATTALKEKAVLVPRVKSAEVEHGFLPALLASVYAFALYRGYSSAFLNSPFDNPSLYKDFEIIYSFSSKYEKLNNVIHYHLR